jgi:ATP-binding cassette subfamily B multidrug efflux pump
MAAVTVPTRVGKTSAWREMRSLLRPWRVHIVLIGACVLLAEAFAVVPPLLMQRIIDDHLTAGIREGVLALALLYLATTAAARGMDFVTTYLTAYVAQGGLRDLRVRLFAHLQRLPLSYYDHTPLGDAISRCTADVETVDTLFTTGVANLITRLAQLATAAIAMFALSPPLSLLALALLPPLAAVTRFFQVHIRDAERERRGAIGLLNTQLHETLSGAEIVRAFCQEEHQMLRFRRALRETVRAYGKALSYNVFYTPLLTVLVAACVAVLLWVGTGGLGGAGSISIGTLTAFVLLFQRFFDPIRNLGEDWQTVQSALSGIERIVQVLQVPPDTRASAAATREASGETGLANAMHPAYHKLEDGMHPAYHQLEDGMHPAHHYPADEDPVCAMHDVAFGYLPEHPVLHGFTFEVRAGEHVALVGRTGAGKTSVVRLLAGLYAPWSGQVRVAGQDPWALTDEQRRSVVGMVPQTVHLFSGTVLENLTLGDMSVPRAQVERAARITTVDRIVATLPQGYDTPLSGAGRGEGVQLSEGQRQLLTLARALVWDPAVLLLDEATAAVDNVSEARFRDALHAAMHGDGARGRALITVAHRLSTVREADRVIVLEDGRVVEQGSPDELIRSGGKFAALVELEAAGWDWRTG